MAKIIYKEGCEGQNELYSIEGIEIDLLNGQKALIYPKYAVMQMLASGHISKWDAKEKTEFEALKLTATFSETSVLFSLGSPASKWVRQFASFGKHIGKDVSGNIIACIKGKQPTAYGFKWKYKYDKN